MINEKRIVSVTVNNQAFAVDIDEPMSIKELAFFLERNRSYISAMKKAGFEMPTNPIKRQCFASLAEAWAWLENNPDFTFNGSYRS